MLEDIRNKVAFITGSSRGIGLASAKLLKDSGAIVILNSSHSSDELKSAAEGINADGYYLCDLTKDSEVKSMIGDIYEKFGKIDLLVNNAGGGGWAGIIDEDEEWQRTIDLDLMGSVHTCRYVLPRMRQAGAGSVVNISSLWGIGQTAKPHIASYCCAKAAVIKLTECLAQEYAPKIRVNSVAPGWTDTKMLEDTSEEDKKILAANTLLGRLAEPNEIANAVVFLLSDAASYITGQTLSVDAGYLLCRQHPHSG